MPDTKISKAKTIYAALAERIDAVLSALEMEGTLPPDVDRTNVAVEPPRDHSSLTITRWTWNCT